MKKAYLLSGHTGEYADSVSWNVRIFLSKTKAKAALKKLADLVEKSGVGYDIFEKNENRHDTKAKDAMLINIKKIDLNAKLDYTGMEYTMEEIELV